MITTCWHCIACLQEHGCDDTAMIRAGVDAYLRSGCGVLPRLLPVQRWDYQSHDDHGLV